VKCADVQLAMVKDSIEFAARLPRSRARRPGRAPGQWSSSPRGGAEAIRSRPGRWWRASMMARCWTLPIRPTLPLPEPGPNTRNARTTLVRVQRVFEHGIAARQEVDDATAKEASARAAEAEAEAAARQAHARSSVPRFTAPEGRGAEGPAQARRTGRWHAGHGDSLRSPTPPNWNSRQTSPLRPGSSGSGCPATVTFSAMPGQIFKASVARVSPAVDRVTGVGNARIAILRSDSLSLPSGRSAPLGSKAVTAPGGTGPPGRDSKCRRGRG